MTAFLESQQIHALLISTARLSAWLLLLAVVFLPLERLFAVYPRKILTKTLASDIGFYFLSGLIPGLLLAPPMALVAVGAHMIVPSSLHAAVAALPIWARALAALVVGEIGFYWGHLGFYLGPPRLLLGPPLDPRNPAAMAVSRGPP